ncbi:hypothetical protein OLX02_02875 [Novosphingobium sp. KCTC 2891]|uniref:hypothetical protein n=1 Tax=Novosphingobium sp. KCTC 2891 TaxID=2989730 RepID=UPI002222B432|nr:hypothetical protein [Novosphingobium sp. KCTC 2891]MCW1381759.1 hypothetical protein [Novosphingobium sp. KCTC 2891]
MSRNRRERRVLQPFWIGAAAAMGVIAVGGAVVAQKTTGPVARYEMRAGTTSGMGAMGAGGRGGMRGAMGMAFGGGNSANHELWLDLGSSRAASEGTPRADHFMPAGAKLGPSVALKTPQIVSRPEQPGERDFQRPKGRMLIFWGCGEHAPAGQPIVIDFARIAAGQMPPGLWSTSVPMDRYVSPANSRTYGHWPSDDGKFVKPDSSLIGAHRVAGNYSPSMSFTLTRDFMGALRAGSTANPSGSVLLRWNALPDATGYHASLIGGKQGKTGGGEMTDVVWWSSSATREFGGGLADWLSPATVARLVANRTVLSPQTTTCTVPVEVKQAAPDFLMTSLYAYGPEESFAYPPKPADPKAVWNIEWSARIRHRSMTAFLAGMPGMEDMGAADEGGQRKPQCKPKKKGGFGGLLGGALGGALGVPSGDDGC